MDIAEFAAAINERAHKFEIGGLQALRMRLKQHKRASGTEIFTSQSVHAEYAFHRGGRSELQFNIGTDTMDGKPIVRSGVAFSFESSRALTDIAVLLPKVERFNEFLRVYPDEYGDFRMWHYQDGQRSSTYLPSIIPPERFRKGVFVFLGAWAPAESLDPDRVLRDFDRLLPLYRFAEQTGMAFPEIDSASAPPQFTPGCRAKRSWANANLPARRLDIQLRHNDMEQLLHDLLVERHRASVVGTERGIVKGGRVDVIVLQGGERTYYEIKTDLSARACVRAALAQLLEYSYWPGSSEATELVVVGEPALDSATRGYLERLTGDFGLPVRYAQLNMQSQALIE